MPTVFVALRLLRAGKAADCASRVVNGQYAGHLVESCAPICANTHAKSPIRHVWRQEPISAWNRQEK